jgi:L-ascorbate metabolism protein UlaG (beta-lactamase superfamily)
MVTLVVITGIIVFFILTVMVFMSGARFGRKPSGNRLQRIGSSANFRDGQFQNISFTPSLAEGVSYGKVMREFFFGKSKMAKPPFRLPSQKVDLRSLPLEQDVFVWFGHSGYYMQVSGKRILVDPVLSGAASPVSFTTRAFPGSDAYTVTDLPDIDYLFITHDHWDHLDYKTIMELHPRVQHIVTSLGTGEHFQRWNIPVTKVTELDWWESMTLGDIHITATPSRHFSGRGFKRNQAIWNSFVLQAPTKKIFIGGDSGYDNHFTEIGEKFGPFDIAILECGQYNEYWKYIHMMPEETVQAAIDVKAHYLVPVHWGKFSLSLHPWDEPIIRASRQAEKVGMPLITPLIGQPVDLSNPGTFPKWWEQV